MSEVKMGSADGYSENGFWKKVLHYSKVAGMEVIERALQLFYATQHPATPAWARTVIYGALAYFILPADAVPDIIPGAGYTDDLGALAAALGTVAMYVNEDIKAQAAKKLKDLFGE